MRGTSAPCPPATRLAEAILTPFTSFADAHARTLQTLLAAPQWSSVVRAGLVEAARREMLAPPPTANVFSTPVEQLVAINGPAVRAMIASGERDAEQLLDALGTWPEQWPDGLPVRLSFLGISVGFGCDMQPRCIYCNQQPVAERMTLDDWKRVIREATVRLPLRSSPLSGQPGGTVGEAGQKPGGGAPQEGLGEGAFEGNLPPSDRPEQGPYVYITGGEPLLLGEGIWGAEGLVRTASLAGAACNLNTNALALTPQAALGLVSAGLGRIHISLDTHRPEAQDAIHQCLGRWEQVMRGLHNMQIAKALLGSAHPVIHINCVLTRLNADDFPEFLRFLVGMKPRVEGSPLSVSSDLDFHLIPVGGEHNARLRLTAEGYERFFSQTWAAADAVWLAYQADLGMPEDQRGRLQEKLPFASPYHRVQQRGELRQWAERAAEGLPASLAMARRCYVAPTQAFVLPDGSQYWCGGHSTSRPTPVGNVLERSLTENIREALPQLTALPADHCRSCAGATLAINQIVEGRLRETIAGWLAPD